MAFVSKVRSLLRSERFRELFVYGVVGVITTLVNWGMYTLFSRGCAWALGLDTDGALLIAIATAVGWVASVAFAFWANKKYVFRSASWKREVLRRELPEFITARLFSLGFDAAFVELCVQAFGMNDLIAKLIANVIVVVLNYFFSKFWIFRKREG